MESLTSRSDRVHADNPFAPFLAQGRAVVLDGGLATALEARGHRLDAKLWSASLLAEAPDEIEAVHLDYLIAGADCVTTATYQASFEGFREAGLSDAQAEELFVRATALARRAVDVYLARSPDRAGPTPLVAASVGPYGAFLADGSEYDGRYGVSRAHLSDFHRRRFELLAASGCDLLACETIPSALEAEVLLELLDETPGVWAWLSFSCRDGSHLSDGSSVADAVALCASRERVAGVGVNCTAPGHVSEWLAVASAAAASPLMTYPNSGEAYDAETKEWSGAGGTGWLEAVAEWLAGGSAIVGGCCRVGPPEIRRIRDVVDASGRVRA